MSKRFNTDYPGVFYREVRRVGGKGAEKVYYVVFKQDNRTVEEKVGFQYRDDMTPARASRIRAERIEGKRISRKELRAQAEAEKAVEAGRWTLRKLWNEYLTVKAENKSIYIDKLRYGKFLEPDFGNKTPEEIVPIEVDRLRITLAKTHSPQSVSHVLRLLKRIVNFGVKRQLCAPLPFFVTMPHVNNLKTEFLTADQVKQLVEAMESDPNQQAARLMRMALLTGMRKGELYRLKWEDVDFERGFLLIREGKGGRSESIPLSEQARAVLELQRLASGETEFVFPGQGGNQAVDFRRGITRIARRAGLPKGFRSLHGLRHHFASSLASSGVDLYTIGRLLTHRDTRTTQRYAHLHDDALKQAAALAGGLVDEQAQVKAPDISQAVK